MKPKLRFVDGEWRAWVPTPKSDKHGKTIHLGDWVTAGLNWEYLRVGKAGPRLVEIDDECVISDARLGTWLEIVDSPGVACELEPDPAGVESRRVARARAFTKLDELTALATQPYLPGGATPCDKSLISIFESARLVSNTISEMGNLP
jgi:hypothetical protein